MTETKYYVLRNKETSKIHTGGGPSVSPKLYTKVGFARAAAKRCPGYEVVEVTINVVQVLDAVG